MLCYCSLRADEGNRRGLRAGYETGAKQRPNQISYGSLACTVAMLKLINRYNIKRTHFPKRLNGALHKID